jgi:hypothetical protein
VNATASQMIHVTDLYATIVRLADPAANAFPADMDAKDFNVVLKNPPITRPVIKSPPGPIVPKAPPVISTPILNIVRTFNFSQWYSNTGNRATIRNGAYKLNFDENETPQYSLYRYVNGEIPDLEYPTIVDASVDVFNDALNGINADAQTNLDLLLDELIANYQQDETTAFPDPR